MCTRFTALTIRQGDAFLLEDNGWTCLYDSGVDGLILDLLKFKGIDKLDLGICSHNDKDHAKGFIELLESNFRIEEIWLPGTWASVLQFIKEHCVEGKVIDWGNWDYNGELDSLFSDESVDDESFNQGLSFIEELKLSEKQGEIHDEMAHFLTENPDAISCYLRTLSNVDYSCRQDDSIIIELFRNYHSPWMALSRQGRQERMLEIRQSLNIKLNNILQIANLANRMGCTIRWFYPLLACANEKTDYGFVSLNSRRMCSIKKPKSCMAYLCLLQLTTVNKYSLVFEYTKKDVPIIRFSADSDSTCQSVSTYPKSIIVTAPHHGARANAKVYKTLQGDDIVWVRSDKLNSSRPCLEFKAQKSNFCLACDKYNFVSEVCFEYNPGLKKWEYICGEECRC